MLSAETLGIDLSLAPGLSVKNAFLYLIFAGIAIETALTRNRRIELLPVIAPYALYFFYAAFTVVFAVLFIDYPGYQLIRSLIALKGGAADNLLVLFVFFYGVLTIKDALSLVKMMIWIVVIANFITVIDALDLPDLGLIDVRDDGRIGGPIGESNQYAAFLALFLPASVALVMLERGGRRLMAMLGVAATILALLMTASRGGFVGVLGGAALGAIFLRRFISRRTIVSAIGAMGFLGIAAVGALYIVGYGELLYERTIALSTEGSSFDVSSGRTYIWGTALRKMIEHPLTLITGYGWDTYSQLRVFRFAPHNTYLKIFFELGAFGLMLVLVAFVNILRTARAALVQSESESAVNLFAFIFGLIGFLIAIFFVDIFSPWLFAWAFVGTAMRVAVLQARSSYSHSSDSSGIRGPGSTVGLT